MNKRNPLLSTQSQAGFSLVDVMVGMVIALLGMIIIFQVFSVSEGIKRTTTSGGDALQNGASSLFTLERSLKEAGYGFLPAVGALAANPVAGTASISIGATANGCTLAVANTSDCLIIRYRNWEFGSFNPNATNFPGITIPALITETISVNAQSQLVSDLNGIISDGIVLLKAEYGIDANMSGSIDDNEWSQTAPVVNGLFPRVDPVGTLLAIRLAVVARSVQPEKPSVAGGVCDTTTVAPTWIGSFVTANHPVAVPLDLSGQADLLAVGANEWKCYRYKTFETTVAFRN